VLYQLSYVGGGSPSLAALWPSSRSRYNPLTDGFLLERGLRPAASDCGTHANV